jgi:hypothetical protein
VDKNAGTGIDHRPGVVYFQKRENMDEDILQFTFADIRRYFLLF